MIRAELDFHMPLPTAVNFPDTPRPFPYDRVDLFQFEGLVSEEDVAHIDDDQTWTTDSNAPLAKLLNQLFGKDYIPTQLPAGRMTRAGLVAREVAQFLGATIRHEMLLDQGKPGEVY